MRIITLTSSDQYRRTVYIVASQIAAFCLSGDGSRTIVILSGGANHNDEGDLWVTESPEEIERMLTEEE